MVESKAKVADRSPLDHREERGSPRFPLSTSAEVIDLGGNVRITGRTCDIAKKGCYVDTISPFAPKSTVALKITRDSQSFETEATVVYSQVGMGMGLSFTTTESEQLRMLESWLSELSGEKPRKTETRAPILQFEVNKEVAQTVDQEARDVLSELILVLSRKGVVTGREGNAILQRLFKKTETSNS
jgi:hypothetical protein